MSEFITLIQQDLVDTARQRDPEWDVRSLHPSLRELRLAYSTTGMPDFSSGETRLTYALAYHPFHAFAAYEVVSQAAHLLPRGKEGVFTAVSLGSGAGAEVLALVRVLARTNDSLHTIRLILVDKEPGWERTRSTTLERTARRWWNGTLEIEHVTADLATVEGRSRAYEAFPAADLVLAQALVTEIKQGDESINVLADLATHFPAQGLLLISDFASMRGTNDWMRDLDEHGSLRKVLGSRQQFPMPLSTGDVAGLFANEDGLRQRRQVTVVSRLYSRPGWRPASVPEVREFVPTDDQNAVLEAFERFVTTDSTSIFVLEGPAGSGKTEIMRRMASIASSNGLIASLHAPTGQAAVRLSLRTGLPATTIHSALYDRSGNPTDNDTHDHEWPPTIEFQRSAMATAGHIVLIDEASMIGDQKYVDETEPPELRFGEGQLLSDILASTVGCGGRVVFVGDGCQLPPFGEETPLALSLEELEKRGHRAVKYSLTTVVRTQEAAEISHITEQLRDRVIERVPGIMSIQPSGSDGVVALNTMALEESLLREFESGRAVALAVRNTDVAEWNQVLRRQMGRADIIPVPLDRLVMTKGSVNHGLLNGTELNVVGVQGQPVIKHVPVRDNGGIAVLTATLQDVVLAVQLASSDWLHFGATIVTDVLHAPDVEIRRSVRRALWVDFVVRSRRQGIAKGTPQFWDAYEADDAVNSVHVSYSYARTVFRAQGGEWDTVLVDGPSFLPVWPPTSRQVYSAVTRVKSALYLRNWPRAGERRTVEELVEKPKSLLQEALLRPVSYRRINENGGGLSAQIFVPDDARSPRVDVFQRDDGDVNFHVQPSPDSADVAKSLEIPLQFWKELENSRAVVLPPLPIEALMQKVESALAESGIDFFVKPSGANQVEVRCFRQANEWSYARLGYRNNGQLTRMWMQQGSELLNEALMQVLLSFWPGLGQG